MVIGDTFVWCPPGTVKDHLWIVISDPAAHKGKCVVINLTNSSHAKHSFTLVQGQHPYIIKDSDVNYGDAFLTSLEHLNGEIASGSAVPNQPMNQAIVTEIIKRVPSQPGFNPKLKPYLPSVK